MSPVEKVVRVDLGERSYSIRIGRGTLARAGASIARATGARRVAVITERGIGRRYATPLLRSLCAAGVEASRIDVPAGDASKSLARASALTPARVGQILGHPYGRPGRPPGDRSPAPR